jgi:hypothetical protein
VGPIEVQQKPELACSETALRDVSTRPLLLPDFRGAPAHRVVELVQRGKPGVKQVMALLKRSRRCRFGAGKLNPHGLKDSSR